MGKTTTCTRCGGPQTETHNCIEFLKTALKRIETQRRELRTRADQFERSAKQIMDEARSWEKQYEYAATALDAVTKEKRALEEKILAERAAFEAEGASLRRRINFTDKQYAEARGWILAFAVALVLALVLSAVLR